MRLWARLLALAIVLTAGLTLVGGAQAASVLSDSALVSASLTYLQANASQWGIRKADEEFRLRRVVRDNLGQTHVRLDQVYQGVPVFGRQMIVHFDRNGTARSATGSYVARITGGAQPAISGASAIAAARQAFSGDLTAPPTAELGMYVAGAAPRLAYRVTLFDEQTPRRVVVFVDAASGVVVHSYNDLRSLRATPKWPAALTSTLPTDTASSPTGTVQATGTGNSLYSGTVAITTMQGTTSYSMTDESRGNLRTTDMRNFRFGNGKTFTDADNVWGNGATTDRASVGVDGHFGAETTFDYYLTVHERNGIFDDGVGPLSRMHYGRSYNNAFWNDSCGCMTYGDGDGSLFAPLASLDVAGHEMTHGVTTSTADLIYDDQSGGLNESMSDIFGTMVEFYAAANGANKTPNYLIGEDIYTPGTAGDALRYMDDPTADGHSIDSYLNYNNAIDVHYTSGIQNNAFYLLAEGGTHRNGGVVTGIGRAQAEQIFYRALTVYMTPSTTFAQARAWTIQAATDLYGAGSQAVISVGQAWTAVGVN